MLRILLEEALESRSSAGLVTQRCLGERRPKARLGGERAARMRLNEGIERFRRFGEPAGVGEILRRRAV